MILITIDDRGLASVGIPDAAGELQEYRADPLPAAAGAWRVQFTRVDAEAAHTVTLRAGGPPDCTCPAQKFRKRGAPPCKHCAAARLLRAFLGRWAEAAQFQTGGGLSRVL